MTSASWTDDKLSRIGTSEELKVASVRKDGTLRPFVTVWVVRVRENSYVRSAYGQDNPWFVRATASGRGRIRAGGNEKDVVFAETATSAHPDIDAAYQGKYGRFGAGIVGSVVGPKAAGTAIRLEPVAGEKAPRAPGTNSPGGDQ
jgi:hypothetical protein